MKLEETGIRGQTIPELNKNDSPSLSLYRYIHIHTYIYMSGFYKDTSVSPLKGSQFFLQAEDVSCHHNHVLHDIGQPIRETCLPNRGVLAALTVWVGRLATFEEEATEIENEMETMNSPAV